MKVRITHGKGWYKDLEGEIFEVSPEITAEMTGDDFYDVVNEYGKTGKIIRVKNCQPVSNYTYAEVDLPSWWDGRPIKGYAWDNGVKVHSYLIGINTKSDFPYIVRYVNNPCTGMHRNFEPIVNDTTAKVVITKDGEIKEVELTSEQVEGLGL